MNPEEINQKWLFEIIQKKFKTPGTNITAIKILAVIGTPIHDQAGQLNSKELIKKINKLLTVLKEEGKLDPKENRHDTLGIKEPAYKLKTS